MKKWTKWLLLSLLAIMIIGGGWYTVNHFTNLTSNSSKVVTPKYVEKKNVKLVALGDSLTHGQGDETNNGGYVGVIKEKIEHHYHQTKVTTVNYGVTGDRSDQILDRLNQQSQLRSDLRSADVITMTVGGNDLMQILEKNVMGSERQVTSSVESGEKTYQQKFMQVRKNKELSKDFETWKKQAKEKINLMKKGKLTEDEVYEWILKNK